MADTRSIQTVLQSPVVKFASGLGLFYGMVKFFDTVGEKLNDDTRLEIAVWLLDVKTTKKVESWPATFAKVFDRVFGERHLSWKCFSRSCLATLFVTLTAVAVAALHSAVAPIPETGIGSWLLGDFIVTIYIAGIVSMLVLWLVHSAPTTSWKSNRR
jgi:hypothetical protein